MAVNGVLAVLFGYIIASLLLIKITNGCISCCITALVQVWVTDGRDTLAVAVSSQVHIRDSSDGARIPCDEATSYVPTAMVFYEQELYWVGRRQSWVGVSDITLGISSVQRRLYSDLSEHPLSIKT